MADMKLYEPLDTMEAMDDSGPEGQDPVGPETKNIYYGMLKGVRNAEYREDFWARARAFYKGGVHLLEDDAVMNRVFPKQVNENPAVYSMRKQMAHYTNHAGSLINHMIGKLMSDPIRVRLSGSDKLPEWYGEFLRDVSPETGEEVSLDDLIREVVLDAMQTKRAYALVEMPAPTEAYDEDGNPAHKTLAQQEELGELDAYVLKVCAESVLDWKKDKAGEFEWVLLGFIENDRESVFEGRGTVREKYWYYTREEWIVWEVEYPHDKEPKPTDVIKAAHFGEHSFGCVPLAELDLPDGLWIMSKLESLAREYFNKRNALSWAEYKALMPMLYEFLDPGASPSLAGPGGAGNRSTNQQRSPAHVQTRQAAAGDGDRAEWVAPPEGPFGHALESAKAIREDMFRVVQQMAQSADTSNGMLRRSEGSKKQDVGALDVVLEEYGVFAKKFSAQLLKIVGKGRDDEDFEWECSGLEDFDSTTAQDWIEDEAVLDTIELPSPKFKAERKKQLVRKLLGSSIDEATMKEIDEEIDAYFSYEGELANFEDEREQVRAELDQQKQAAEQQTGDSDDPELDGMLASAKTVNPGAKR